MPRKTRDRDRGRLKPKLQLFTQPPEVYQPQSIYVIDLFDDATREAIKACKHPVVSLSTFQLREYRDINDVCLDDIWDRKRFFFPADYPRFDADFRWLFPVTKKGRGYKILLKKIN